MSQVNSSQTNDNSPVAGSRRLRRVVNASIAIYWTSMFVGTHIPNPDAIINPNVSDKLLHFVAFYVLSLLLGLRVRVLSRRWPSHGELGRIAGVCAAYAVLDESLQAVPIINRHADPFDALADVAGTVVALLCIAAATRLSTRR